MKHKDPEREGLASVSKFASYAQCKIKYKLELLAPPDKSTKFSMSGDKGHSAMAGQEVELSRDEQDTVDACLGQEEELVDNISQGTAILEIYREQRLFYKEAGEKVFSGKPDTVFILDDELKTAVVPDYKLGFMRAPRAATNLQLRGQAVLVWQNYGSRRVFPAIIQPRKNRWADPVEYGLPELSEAREEVLELMQAIHDPNAQANPSAEACRWCAAKLICKAAYNPSRALASSREDMIVEMSDDMLSSFGELTEQAQLIINAAKAELKERVTARPSDFPNWYLQSTGSSSWIDKPREAYSRLSEMLTKEEFSSICKPSIEGLVDLVRTKTGASKPLARERIERILGELFRRKLKEPSLKYRQTWEKPLNTESSASLKEV